MSSDACASAEWVRSSNACTRADGRRGAHLRHPDEEDSKDEQRREHKEERAVNEVVRGEDGRRQQQVEAALPDAWVSRLERRACQPGIAQRVGY